MSYPSWIDEIDNPTVSQTDFIPIYAPAFCGKEKEYLLSCLDQTWISPKGMEVQKFEDAFASYCKAKYAIACASGTAALFLSLVSQDIGPGDEVIVPSFTMISTAFAVTYTGATPVFVDCDSDTGLLSLSATTDAVTKRTKAVLPVDIYGTPAPLKPLQEMAQKHGLIIIEDAAEAIGSTYQSQQIGSVSECTAFSLYINKIVTCGQGGMITTNNRYLAQKIRRINNYSFSSRRHFWHQSVGYNLKLTSLQAAIGLAQLEQIDTFLSRKQEIAHRYANLLRPLQASLLPLRQPDSCSGNNWMVAYVLIADHPAAQRLRDHLGKLGIETRSFFLPLHLQPCYRQLKQKLSCPHSERLAQTGILLPSGPGLTNQQIDRVCQNIEQFFRTYAC